MWKACPDFHRNKIIKESAGFLKLFFLYWLMLWIEFRWSLKKKWLGIIGCSYLFYNRMFLSILANKISMNYHLRVKCFLSPDYPFKTSQYMGWNFASIFLWNWGSICYSLDGWLMNYVSKSLIRQIYGTVKTYSKPVYKPTQWKHDICLHLHSYH